MWLIVKSSHRPWPRPRSPPLFVTACYPPPDALLALLSLLLSPLVGRCPPSSLFVARLLLVCRRLPSSLHRRRFSSAYNFCITILGGAIGWWWIYIGRISLHTDRWKIYSCRNSLHTDGHQTDISLICSIIDDTSKKSGISPLKSKASSNSPPHSDYRSHTLSA